MDTASLQLDYYPADQLAQQSTTWWGSVLGVVGFEKPPRIQPGRVPVTASMTPSLGNAGNLCEVWRVAGGSGATLNTGALDHGHAQFRYSDELLFGSIVINETIFDGNESEGLLNATMAAYGEIFAVLKETQHPHLLRVWNYLPEINGDADGDERYRHFNSARRQAFRDSGRSTTGPVPAASALGSPAGSPISIYFLACSESPQMIENPRQTSAYFYPPKFGIHSPIFSRACVLSEANGTNLFVSGTASIVGHETIHRGDVSAQTRESLLNIEALLSEANRIVGSSPCKLDDLKFKVYVRDPTDLVAIESELATALPDSASIVYLQADVCREELLVEIEATGSLVRN